MNNTVDKKDVLQYGSYYKIHNAEKQIVKSSVLNKRRLSSVLYNSAMVLVLAVCGMVVAGVSLPVSIEIGIAGEAVMMLVLLVLALKTNLFEKNNRR
jgi:hypothetical protein